MLRLVAAFTTAFVVLTSVVAFAAPSSFVGAYQVITNFPQVGGGLMIINDDGTMQSALQGTLLPGEVASDMYGTWEKLNRNTIRTRTLSILTGSPFCGADQQCFMELFGTQQLQSSGDLQGFLEMQFLALDGGIIAGGFVVDTRSTPISLP